MRIYFYNESNVLHYGVARIEDVPAEFPEETTQAEQDLYVQCDGEHSFFQGTKKQILKKAKHWLKLPPQANNIFQRSIGKAVLDALQ